MLNFHDTLPPEAGRVSWTEVQKDKLRKRLDVSSPPSALSAFELEDLGTAVGDTLMENFGVERSADDYSDRVRDIAAVLTSSWHPDSKDKFMEGLMQGAGIVAPVAEGAEV